MQAVELAFWITLLILCCCISCVTRLFEEEESAYEKDQEDSDYEYEQWTRRRQAALRRRDAERRESTRAVPVKVDSDGELIENRFRFSVKVLNDSEFNITDVTVFVLSFPRKALKLDADDDDVHISRMEPRQSTVVTFDFLPTQDCVLGDVIAGISYIDHRGQAETINTEPYVIRAVCDLLQAEPISSDDFELQLESLEQGDVAFKISDSTPEEMHDKTLRVLNESNFHEVTSEITREEGITYGIISGWAKGKYTGKMVGVEVFVSGPSHIRGASCQIRVSGEDDAMIIPAIDDLKERLSAWLCPLCRSSLTPENVDDLKDGRSIVCPFCTCPIGRRINKNG